MPRHKNNLFPGKEAHYREHLVERVFKLNKDQHINGFTKGTIFFEK